MSGGTFRLVHPTARRMAADVLAKAPDGYVCVIRPPNRSLDQNAKLHSLISDIAKAKPVWNGVNMDDEDWKALLILSHAVATQGEGAATRLVPDLESHGFVQLRESSARMSKERSSSLIEYCMAWAVSHDVPLRER